jgi:predicted nucleic acid-binding Zn ribbon protein
VISFIKNHSCDKCGRKFGKVEELMHHQLLAHESQLYECRECGMGFEGMEQMRDHAKRSHSYHKQLDERNKKDCDAAAN